MSWLPWINGPSSGGEDLEKLRARQQEALQDAHEACDAARKTTEVVAPTAEEMAAVRELMEREGLEVDEAVERIRGENNVEPEKARKIRESRR